MERVLRPALLNVFLALLLTGCGDSSATRTNVPPPAVPGQPFFLVIYRQETPTVVLQRLPITPQCGVDAAPRGALAFDIEDQKTCFVPAIAEHLKALPDGAYTLKVAHGTSESLVDIRFALKSGVVRYESTPRETP